MTSSVEVMLRVLVGCIAVIQLGGCASERGARPQSTECRCVRLMSDPNTCLVVGRCDVQADEEEVRRG